MTASGTAGHALRRSNLSLMDSTPDTLRQEAPKPKRRRRCAAGRSASSAWSIIAADHPIPMGLADPDRRPAGQRRARPPGHASAICTSGSAGSRTSSPTASAIDNPPDWHGDGNFATADHLALDVDAMAYIQQPPARPAAPSSSIKPVVDAQQSGGRHRELDTSAPTSPAPRRAAARAAPTRRSAISIINDGQAHVRSAKLAADFQITAATKATATAARARSSPTAKGTYAKQPITAEFVGGALLSLRDASQPYPIDLKLANGPTTVALNGHGAGPAALRGRQRQARPSPGPTCRCCCR